MFNECDIHTHTQHIYEYIILMWYMLPRLGDLSSASHSDMYSNFMSD